MFIGLTIILISRYLNLNYINIFTKNSLIYKYYSNYNFYCTFNKSFHRISRKLGLSEIK